MTSSPPNLASFSAFFLALQFPVECFPFLQKVHWYSGEGATVQNLVPWSLPLVFASDPFATPVGCMILLSTFPAGVSILLLRM